MKILVTGANGLLGTDLMLTLAEDHDVLGVARRPAPGFKLPYRQVDLSAEGAADKLIQSWNPELVFHCAAMTQVDLCETSQDEARRLNVDLIAQIVSACNASGAFPVFFSSDYVFDGRKQGEYLEDDPRAPLNFYGETKVLAENHIAKNAAQYSVFRISWLYGMHGSCFPKTVLEKAKTQKEFEIVSDQTGRPVYTRDVAVAFKNYLSAKGSGWKKPLNREIFHLANEGTVSWADFAKFLFEHAGREAQVKPISSDQLKRPAQRPKNSVLSLEKASRVLGIRLRLWQEAALDFLKEYGKLKNDLPKISL